MATAAQRRRGYAAALIVATLAIVWIVRERHRPARLHVATADVSRGAIVRRIVAVGTLQAVTTVTVGAQVSGTIQSLHADFNAIVRAGEVIATLDPALFQASVAEAQAVLGRAQADEAQAQADERALQAAVEDADEKLTRAQALAGRELIPSADLDAAKNTAGTADTDLKSGESRIVQARAAVTQAQASLAEARVNLDRTVIKSPIDGIVVSRNVDVGQTVAAAVEAPVLFIIASDVSHMQVNVELDESDIGGIGPGQPASFQVESYPNETFEGTLSQLRLQPTTINGTVSYTAVVDVPNPEDRLRPGMTATVALDGSRRDNVVRIPNTALTFRPSLDVLDAVAQAQSAPPPIDTSGDPARRRVWRFDGKHFLAVNVRVGLSDGQWTELADGPIGPGDSLVTSAALAP